MKRIKCPVCGVTVAIALEEGDPGYIDAEQIQIQIGDKQLPPIDVKNLKEIPTLLVCWSCGAEFRLEK